METLFEHFAAEKTMIYTNPVFGFLRYLLLYISGRVVFLRKEIGKKIIMEDSKDFTVFRRVVIKKYFNKGKEPEGLFIVRFTPAMEIKKNIKLSTILMLFIMGFKGFRSKYWCVNEETGTCLGIYEWDTVKDAERYSKSIAVRNMTKRSLSSSIIFQVLANKEENHNWQLIDSDVDRKAQFKKNYSLA